MNKKFGIDTDSFENFLNNNDFVVYDSAYSNSGFTLLSMGDIYAMEPISGFGAGNQDASYVVREIIGGNENNFLMRTLKNSDYFTESWFMGSKFTQK